MQTSNTPADAVTALVINLTAEEKEFLLDLITNRMRVSRSNMTDMNISEKDREYHFDQHQFGVRLLTKLGA